MREVGNEEVAGEMRWPHGHVVVEKLAGRIAELTFSLPGGINCHPFTPPHWLDADDAQSIPALLRRLRGEWPCVPFGFDLDREPFEDWGGTSADDAIDLPHGYASSSEWTVMHAETGSLALSVDYPADHPIARLERRIEPDQHAPAINITLTIEPRRDCRLPIGLHPMFRLPSEPGSVELDAGANSVVMTFPGGLTPNSHFRPNRLSRLDGLELDDGTTISGAAVPLPYRAVELAQVLRADGKAALRYLDEGYEVALTWEPTVFPSLLLWYSNHGNDTPPWSGRHRALGVEPICAAFDLGVGTSSRHNPISTLGIPTAAQFRAGVRLKTQYRLAARAL